MSYDQDVLTEEDKQWIGQRLEKPEIVEDFPALSDRDFAYARLVARFGEKPGRPKKRLAFKREHGVA